MNQELRFKLTNNSIDRYCDFDPDGWNEEMIDRTRSITYWGMMSEYSIPLKFQRSDADYLRNIYYSSGMGSVVYLTIYKRSSTDNTFSAKYLGKLNFADVEDTANYFSCSVVNSGLSQDFKNKEKIDYLIEPNAYQKLRYRGLTGNYESPLSGAKKYYNSYTLVAEDNYLPCAVSWTSNFKDINDGKIQVNTAEASGYFVEVLEDCRLRIDLSLNKRRVSFQGMQWNGQGSNIAALKEVLILNRGGVLTALRTMTTTNVPVALQNPTDYDFDFDYSHHWYPLAAADEVEFLAGDKLGVFLYHYNPIVGGGRIFDGEMMYDSKQGGVDGEIGGGYDAITKIYAQLPDSNELDTYMWVIPPMRMFEVLADKMGGYPAKSDYLDAIDNLKFTSVGLWLGNKIGLQTSIYDFFRHFQSIDDVGIGIEIIDGDETLVFEHLSYFLDPANDVISFSNIKDYKITTASDLIPSVIKIGFNEFEYGNSLGLQEFMGVLEMKTENTETTLELNYISPYRMDNAGFDSLKMKTIAETTGKTDDAMNNEIFCFDCNFVETIGVNDFYELNRTGIAVTTVGFKYPDEAFNLFYTPKRNLLRKQAYINSVLFGYTGNIEVTAFKKYPYLKTQETGEDEITEVAPVAVSSLTDRYFYPIYVEFSAVVSELMENNFIEFPNNLPEISINNSIFEGYTMDMSKKLATPSENTIKILLTSDNDLNNLK